MIFIKMRQYALFALLVMAMADPQSEPKQNSWRRYYYQDRPSWRATARTPRARELGQQATVLTTPATVPSHISPVLSEMSPDSGTCGVDAISTKRIIGGYATGIKQHPWLVQIESHNKREGIAVRTCGGFLINHRHVLSAAHCFDNIEQLTPVNVILGEYNQIHEGPDCVDTPEEVRECTDGAISVPIEKTTTHPLYSISSSEIHFDIAIVRMNRNVQYTKFIRPICLPTTDITASPPADLRFTVAGWGRTESAAYSDVKLEVVLPYVNNKECKAGSLFFATEDHVCAGREDGKDSCKGDSGGPLMYINDGVHTAVGIVSAGLKCGTTAVYTKVFNYLSWINQNIQP